MIRKHRISALVCLCIMFISFMSVDVYAAATFVLPDEDVPVFEELIQEKSASIKVSHGLDDSDDNDGFGEDKYAPLFIADENTQADRWLFNKVDFSKLSNMEQGKLVNKFVSLLQDSNMSGNGKRRVYNTLKGNLNPALQVALPRLLDESTPNIFKAMSMLRPFTGWLGTTLGVIIVIVLGGMILGIVIDLAFITIPTLQNALTTIGSKRDGERPFLASLDAIKAVKESEEGSGDGRYKDALFIYFKRRAVHLAIMFLCLGYLLSGKIVNLFLWFFDVVNVFN